MWLLAIVTKILNIQNVTRLHFVKSKVFDAFQILTDKNTTLWTWEIDNNYVVGNLKSISSYFLHKATVKGTVKWVKPSRLSFLKNFKEIRCNLLWLSYKGQLNFLLIDLFSPLFAKLSEISQFIHFPDPCWMKYS